MCIFWDFLPMNRELFERVLHVTIQIRQATKPSIFVYLVRNVYSDNSWITWERLP